MDNIKHILNNVMGKMVHKTARPNDSIENTFLRSLEGNEQDHVHLVGEKGGSLLVNVDSSAWLYKMNRRKSDIIRKMNNEFPELKDIRLRIGKIR